MEETQLCLEKCEQNIQGLKLQNPNQTETYSNENRSKDSPKKLNKIPPISKEGWKRYIGICFGLGASLSFATAMILAKVLPQYDPSIIGLWRFVITFLLSLPVLFYCQFGQKKHVVQGIWPITDSAKFKIATLLVLRGLCGCSALLLHIYAIKYIELPDATVISLSTPVFVSLVARIFLGEKCGVMPNLAAILTFFGVVIIARPPLLTGAKEFDINNLIGTVISLGSMICSATVFVVLRYLRELHFILAITALGLIGILECTIVSITISKFQLPQTGLDWVYGLGGGFFNFLGQILITGALKFEQAGPIALTRTCDVVFAFLLQLIFLNIYADIFSLVGASIVVLGVVVIVFRKWLSTLTEGDLNREKYWCFLK